MKAAKTIVIAGGVQYEVTDTRMPGESINTFVARHLEHVAAFIAQLGDEVESIETEFSP